MCVCLCKCVCLCPLVSDPVGGGGPLTDGSDIFSPGLLPPVSLPRSLTVGGGGAGRRFGQLREGVQPLRVAPEQHVGRPLRLIGRRGMSDQAARHVGCRRARRLLSRGQKGLGLPATQPEPTPKIEPRLGVRATGLKGLQPVAAQVVRYRQRGGVCGCWWPNGGSENG